MKALVLYGPDDYRICERERPRCPGHGLLVKVLACGLCGSDLRTLRSGHRNIVYPRIIGHEIAGIVEETGENYSGEWKKGDTLAIGPMVYCGSCVFCRQGRHEFCAGTREIAQQWDGGFAEYIAIPGEAVHFGTISRIPEGFPPRLATLSEPASSCVHAQMKAGIGLGDSVVIFGCGPIGCMHIELARARGARKIIVVDVSDDRLGMCKQFGPDVCVNSAREDLCGIVDKATGGMGADVVITANPVGVTQVQALEIAKKGGRIVFFGGLPHGDSKPGIDTNLIHYKGLTVIGISTFNLEHYRLALECLVTGVIPAEKIVTHTLPLEAADEAVRLAREGKALKVVLEP